MMISRNDPCWCGSGQKWKKCHFPKKADPNFEEKSQEYLKKYQILLKSPEQVAGIKRACKTAAIILKKTCAYVKAGMSTLEVNNYAAKLYKEMGSIAATLGYGSPPYPRETCISLNEVICHGIPDEKTIIKEGDILNIDVTAIVGGYFGDCSAMVTVGKISEEKKRVVDVCYECTMRAIHILKPGVPIYEIGNVIEDYASQHHCSVVNQFVGHGVGVDFHEPPQIPFHYNHLNIPLVEGMTFTIEPMINAGKREAIIDPTNEWEARTIDGKPSAQWEHTILITADGYEILTVADEIVV